MTYFWNNAEKTILSVARGDGSFEIVEPGHPLWHDLSTRADIVPFTAAVPTPEQIIAAYEAAIRAHVRDVAAQRQYDSPESAASYVASTVPLWAAEGAAFVAWRDAVWSQANADLAAVLAGAQPQPESPEAYIATLPVIDWPEQ